LVVATRKHRLENRFSSVFSNGFSGQVLERLGGRTRARTWDPMIKSHTTFVETKREFFKLCQNPHIAYQWLAGKRQTKKAVEVL
jgi:hypothetical protein